MIIENIINAFAKFTMRDILDIFLIFLLIYYLLLLIKGTKSYQMALGLMLIGFFALITDLLKLTAFAFILNNFFTYLVFAIIVLFQGEFRKILAEIGGKLKTKFIPTDISRIRDEIVNAVVAMALGKVGALIAVEREIKLKSYIDKHIRIDALISKDMLLDHFFSQYPAARRSGDHFRRPHRRRQLLFSLSAAPGINSGRRPAPGRHRHQPGIRLRGHRRFRADRQDIPGRQR